MKNILWVSVILLFSIALACCGASTPPAQKPSQDEFKSPYKTYYPKTWMHAMNGNLSKPGYTKDIEALGEAGIGGAILFHVHRQNRPYFSRYPDRLIF